MNEFFTRQKARLLISLILLFFVGCDREPTKSVFVENPTPEPDPVINSIEPPDRALAGIGQITIKGSNFSPTKEVNAVFFGSTSATVVSASESELVVQTPNVIADSLQVKVSVIGALLFSNVIYYSLQRAVEEYGNYGPANEDLYGIAVDKDENLYVSVVSRRIDKVTPDGEREDNYATTRPPLLLANHMKVGPGGYIYLVRNNTVLYRIPPGGGDNSSETFTSSLPGRIYDLDFDQNGNIYAAGDGDSLTIVYPDGSFETVADYTDTFIKAVRVFNGYVYVAGNMSNSLEAVWRNQINAPNDLGPTEMVFNLTSELGEDIEIQSLTFAEDGDMYIGTTAPDPILVVHPDGSNEPLYPGILAPEMYDMAWGNDIYLYVTRRASIIAQSETRILRINMQKKGAPYYGLQ